MTDKITADTIITGAQFREFYVHNWPGSDYYIDDVSIEIENYVGDYILADDAKIRLRDLGYICWQGDSSIHAWGTHWPLYQFYRDYVEKQNTSTVVQTTSTVVLQIPSEQLEVLQAFAATHGWIIK